MITIQEFAEKLEKEFDDIAPGTIKPETNYREIKGWSSMHALIIIAFVDTEFDLILNGADLKSAQTIADLYRIIKEKIN